MMTNKCKHPQCEICLERECHRKFAERFKKYGPFIVCRACVLKCISWSHTTACRWGGGYADGKECGEKPAPSTNVPLGKSAEVGE